MPMNESKVVLLLDRVVDFLLLRSGAGSAAVPEEGVFGDFVFEFSKEYVKWSIHDICHEHLFLEKICFVAPKLSDLFNPAFESASKVGMNVEDVEELCFSKIIKTLTFHSVPVSNGFFEKHLRIFRVSLAVHEFAARSNENIMTDATKKASILQFIHVVQAQYDEITPIVKSSIGFFNISTYSTAHHSLYQSFCQDTAGIKYSAVLNICKTHYANQTEHYAFVCFFRLMLDQWMLGPVIARFELKDIDQVNSDLISSFHALFITIMSEIPINDMKQIHQFRVDFSDKYADLKTQITESGTITKEEFEAKFVHVFMSLHQGEFIDALMHGSMGLEAI